jgi:hypothetical protein
MTKQCHGQCEEDGNCQGEVRLVNVKTDGGFDWGNFMYCDSAIKLDKRNGFQVVEVANESN